MKLRNVISLLIVFAMLFILVAACADDNGGNETVTNENGTATQDTGTDGGADTNDNGGGIADTATGQPWNDLDYFADPVAWIQSQRFDETVTVTSVRSELAGWSYPDGQDIFDNGYTRFMYEHLNIRIEYDWVVDTSQYDTRLSLALASGEIPDFFYADSATFAMLVEDGIIADLSDYFAVYASPRVREITEFFPEGFDSARDNDGRLMAIPQMGFGVMSQANSLLWIRNDWLEASGRNAPSTIDEMIDLANVFKDEFGASYGLAVDNSLFGGVNNLLGIFNAYHAYPTIWVERGGEIVFGGIQPEVRTALERLQQMYADGFLSAEFAVSDTGRVNEDILNGEVGMMFGANWSGWWPLGDSLHLDENAIWIPHPVPNSDDTPVSMQTHWPVTYYLVVNRNSENADAVIRMLNAFQVLRDDFFLFPEDWRDQMMDSWQMSPVWFEDPSDDYIAFRALSEAVVTRDTSNVPPAMMFNYYNMLQWADERLPDGFGRYVQMMHSYRVLSEYLLNDRILMSAMRGPQPPGLAASWPSLETFQEEAFVRIIMGDPIEAFDDFVASWLAMGGEAGTREVNELYN